MMENLSVYEDSQLSGFILNINKPRGMTSHDVVARIRRLFKLRRVGHGGTLDPLAEGVLIMFVGKATRLAQYALNTRKVYICEITLGVATDTYDGEGRVTKQADPGLVQYEQLEVALRSFIGRVSQTPPPYSAIKRAGTPLYELARRGITVVPEAREVEIYDIQLLDWHCPIVKLVVECGKGTYMRSLAHDLGEKLGCGGHLARLVRTQVGPFSISEAVALEELATAVEEGWWQSLAYSMDELLLHLPAAILASDSIGKVEKGQPWTSKAPVALDRHQCRAYTADGQFKALLEGKAGEDRWWPTRVF